MIIVRKTSYEKGFDKRTLIKLVKEKENATACDDNTNFIWKCIKRKCFIECHKNFWSWTLELYKLYDNIVTYLSTT